MNELRKYPRTRHIAGSRLQPGDEDLAATPFAEISGRFLVVEEKLDGANAALSFDAEGKLWLQSRGHFLTGGGRERHFAPFKKWASEHAAAFHQRLGARYLMYGEWLYAKHTIFYDALPGYFMEFDILDRETGSFLTTESRRALLTGLPLPSVPVLREGPVRRLEELTDLISRSLFKSDSWRKCLREDAAARGLDVERALNETDPSDDMEGLYIKVEEDGQVVARYKWVRHSFLSSVLESGSHWLSRPILPNRVCP
jgi:hypothetical protein